MPKSNISSNNHSIQKKTMKSCRYQTPPVPIMVCIHGCSRPIRTSLHELRINEDQTLTSHQSFFSLFCSVLLFDTYLCCGGNSLSWEIQTFLSQVTSTNSLPPTPPGGTPKRSRMFLFIVHKSLPPLTSPTTLTYTLMLTSHLLVHLPPSQSVVFLRV